MTSVIGHSSCNHCRVDFQTGYRLVSCCGLALSVHRLYKKISERFEQAENVVSDRRWNLFLKDHFNIQIFKELSYVASCALAMFKLFAWDFDVTPLGVTSSLFSLISSSLDLVAQIRARMYINRLCDDLQGLDRDVAIRRITENLDFKISLVAVRVISSLSFTLFSVTGIVGLGVMGFASFAISAALSVYLVYLSKKNQQITDNNYFVRELLLR